VCQSESHFRPVWCARNRAARAVRSVTHGGSVILRVWWREWPLHVRVWGGSIILWSVFAQSLAYGAVSVGLFLMIGLGGAFWDAVPRIAAMPTPDVADIAWVSVMVARFLCHPSWSQIQQAIVCLGHIIFVGMVGWGLWHAHPALIFLIPLGSTWITPMQRVARNIVFTGLQADVSASES